MTFVSSGLREKPKCNGCLKPNAGFVNINGLWFCGECIKHYFNQSKEQTLKIIKENAETKE